MGDVREELLPCPFCGNDVNDDEGCFPASKDRGWRVQCGNPSCTASVVHDSRVEAIRAWNRRALSARAAVPTLWMRGDFLGITDAEHVAQQWRSNGEQVTGYAKIAAAAAPEGYEIQRIDRETKLAGRIHGMQVMAPADGEGLHPICFLDANAHAAAISLIDALLAAAPQPAMIPAYRTSLAYDVGFKDGQKQGCGRCNDTTKPCDISGGNCAADAPAAPQPAGEASPVIVGWMHEDELPESYPYDAMFPHSRVDFVRMFPVYAPPEPAPSAPADWNVDSSLETWFPYTAERLKALEAENEKLKAQQTSAPAPADVEALIQHHEMWANDARESGHDDAVAFHTACLETIRRLSATAVVKDCLTTAGLEALTEEISAIIEEKMLVPWQDAKPAASAIAASLSGRFFSQKATKDGAE